MNFANLHQNFILLSPLTLNQHLDNHAEIRTVSHHAAKSKK